MKVAWTKGLTKEEAIECRSEFVGSVRTRERLKALLLEKADSARKAARSGSNYDNPNWALSQADSIGYEKALFEIISLIS
jgi:hypothetical protein